MHPSNSPVFPTRRQIAFTGLAAALLPPARATSLASTYPTAWPTQPLRMVIPFAPGGTSDVIARLMAKPLGDLR